MYLRKRITEPGLPHLEVILSIVDISKLDMETWFYCILLFLEM